METSDTLLKDIVHRRLFPAYDIAAKTPETRIREGWERVGVVGERRCGGEHPCVNCYVGEGPCLGNPEES